MDNQSYVLDEDLTITLELEDGTIVECDILIRFPIGEQQYIALAPKDENVDSIYLYRFAEDADGQPVLTSIETDDEYEIVADRFDEILDEIEWEEAEQSEE